MTGSPRSWSARPVELRQAGIAACLGVLLFLVSVGLLHTGLDQRQIVDTPLYQRYGEAMLDGQVPYRDFELEYPPGALPMFTVPALAPEEHYRTAFEVLVALLGAGTVVLVVVALARLGAGPSHLVAGAALVGLVPLALGSVVLTRYDIWPAFLTAAVLAAALSGRDRLAFGLLGLATVSKVYPAILLPLLLLFAWRTHGRRRALGGLATFAGAVALVLIPFAILGPGGLLDALTRQADRPLQIESLGSAILLVGDQLGLYTPTVVNGSGSQNLWGALPDGLATGLTVVQVVAVVAIWALFAAGRRGPTELAAASAASVAAFVAFGKVLSPQFLIWLAPLVALVGGAAGAAACGLYLLALVLTHAWFPERYWDLVGLAAGPTWLLAARDALLVALAAVLAVATARGRAASRSA